MRPDQFHGRQHGDGPRRRLGLLAGRRMDGLALRLWEEKKEGAFLFRSPSGRETVPLGQLFSGSRGRDSGCLIVTAMQRPQSRFPNSLGQAQNGLSHIHDGAASEACTQSDWADANGYFSRLDTLAKTRVRLVLWLVGLLTRTY